MGTFRSRGDAKTMCCYTNPSPPADRDLDSLAVVGVTFYVDTIL